MAYMNPKQRELLVKLGKEPISLPAEIYHGGDIRLQQMHCVNPKCPDGQCRCGMGMHHLPQYQKTGTYNHPNLVRQRLREAQDALERARTMKMTDTERRKWNINGDLAPLEAIIESRKKDWVTYVGSSMLNEIKGMMGSEDFMEAAMKQSIDPGSVDLGPAPAPAVPPMEESVRKADAALAAMKKEEKIEAPAPVEAPEPVIERKRVTRKKKAAEPEVEKDAIDIDAEGTVSAEQLARAAGAATRTAPIMDFKSDK